MSLQEMLDEMREHARNGDFEVAHSRADTILCKALELLAKDTRDEQVVVALLAAYDDVGKWYA